MEVCLLADDVPKQWKLGTIIGAAVAVAVVCAVIVWVMVHQRHQATGGEKDAGGPMDPQRYHQTVSAFYVGMIALEVTDNTRARDRLTRVTSELAPQEPAGWADLGLLQLREGDFPKATEHLTRALKLAPQSAEVEVLCGLLESYRGDFDKAISYLQSAVQHDPKSLRARYALAATIERRGGEGTDKLVSQQLDELLKLAPQNLAVLLDAARLAAKQSDGAKLRSYLDQISAMSGGWKADAKERLAAAIAQTNPRAATIEMVQLRNVLLPLADFQRQVQAVQSPTTKIGEPIDHFLKLPTPSPDPAPPDESIEFAGGALPVEGAAWTTIVPAWLKGDGPATAFVANGREVRRVGPQGGAAMPFPGGANATPPGPDGVLAVDWRNNFKTSLVLAGAGGVRLMQQNDDGTAFTDVTTAAIADAAVRDGDYVGAWAADLDLDGDLDIILAPRNGPPIMLRNNLDGTFAIAQPFEGVSGLRQFVWADLDGDGVPDACLLDASGKVTVLTNDRTLKFHARAVPADVHNAVSIAAADLTRRGRLDLVVLLADGNVLRIFDDGGELKSVAIAKTDAKATRLTIADVDNNGAADLIVTGDKTTSVLLGTDKGQYVPAAHTIDARILAVSPDPSAPGGQHLLGLTAAGEPIAFAPRSTKGYHYQLIRPRANPTGMQELEGGKNKINSYAIGGEVELRVALLYGKQAINGGALHFGLGQNAGTDALRIVWPNGNVQGEFELKPDVAFTADQRLKGSCPMLFSFDGRGMQFVTDCLWRSPLGLRINAQDTAQTMQTEDWVKVRSDQIAPRADGSYDLRITAELWETHYIDHVTLMAVDHPAGTEVFVDERFARTPPPLKVFVTSTPRPFARAVDQQGKDVSEVVRTRDRNYLGGFALGEYQGVASDHFVELELGPDAPLDVPLLLVGFGWVHPTDSSINVSMAQGKHVAPSGLVLEVADGHGGWRVAKEGLGFPSGKLKTVIIPLEPGIFAANAPRRLRLRTNLEVFWDQLGWAEPKDDALAQTKRLPLRQAALRYRGFSVIEAADARSPELPQYDRLMVAAPRWRDLEGFYTRYGDVRELLEKVDDRYVIMNAGDELGLRFESLPAPANGTARDFVVISDGWEKDGDYNTAFGRTVLPLPRHDWPAYDTMPARLQDDPVYRRHPDDWLSYHTRYVGVESFNDAMVPRRGGH
jgi:Tfp pilus assembly protein PilF